MADCVRLTEAFTLNNGIGFDKGIVANRCAVESTLIAGTPCESGPSPQASPSATDIPDLRAYTHPPGASGGGAAVPALVVGAPSGVANSLASESLGLFLRTGKFPWSRRRVSSMASHQPAWDAAPQAARLSEACE